MHEILHLINEMSPYLLLGFLLAGLMHVYIPGEYYKRYLSRNSFSSVLYAALFGIPLPLCSCGVIPTAMSLRKEGASKGAVASFLIATPQTGIDSIIATFSLMGLPFAIIRPIAALVTAIFGGYMVNKTSSTDAYDNSAANHEEESHCCCHDHHEEHKEKAHCCCHEHHEEHEEKEHCCCHDHHEEHKEEAHCCCHDHHEEEEHSCCHEHHEEDDHCCCGESHSHHDEKDHCCCGNHSHAEGEEHGLGKIGAALRYAYIEMMEDIGKWLVIGLVIAGLITVFVPAELFQVFQGNTLASMLLVLAIALPMYLCATGSIPIAVALMMKGLTPGAALVLLMAGPACNFASILIINKVLGRRTLITYIASIIVGAVAFGYLIDYLQFNGIVDFLQNLTMQQACCEEGDDGFSWLCTAVLAILLINALILPKLGLRKAHHCHCGCEEHHEH